MAIQFACQCGKPLQAPDTFAGRKMRCPACGTVLSIPGSVAPTAAVRPVARAPVPTAVFPTPAAAAPAPAPVKTTPMTPARQADETEVIDAPAIPARSARADKAVEDEKVLAIEAIADDTELLVPRRPKKRTTRRRVNVWSDPALGQEVTPWPANDRNCVGAISERERGDGGWWIVLVVLLLAGGAAAAVWFLGQ